MQASKEQCFNCLRVGGAVNACDVCTNLPEDSVDVCVSCSNHPTVVEAGVSEACIPCANGPSPEARQLCQECVVGHTDSVNMCIACMRLYNSNAMLGSAEDRMSQCYGCMNVAGPEQPLYICTTRDGWRLYELWLADQAREVAEQEVRRAELAASLEG